jgi:putative Ca2+/H+ antiporter (TMEM165/GDT1 family)
VVLGAIAGHGIATFVAVLGGSFLGKYVDERVVQYVGGSLFLVSDPPAFLAALMCHFAFYWRWACWLLTDVRGGRCSIFVG